MARRSGVLMVSALSIGVVPAAAQAVATPPLVQEAAPAPDPIHAPELAPAGTPVGATPASPATPPTPAGNRGPTSTQRLTAFMAQSEAWLLAGESLPPELPKLLEPMAPADRLLAVAYLRRLGLLVGPRLDMQRLMAPVPADANAPSHPTPTPPEDGA